MDFEKDNTDPKQNELNTQIGGLKVAVVQLTSHATPQRRQSHSQEEKPPYHIASVPRNPPNTDEVGFCKLSGVFT